MTVLYNRLAVVFVVFANACGADTAGSIAPDLGQDVTVVNPDGPAFVSPDLGRDLAIVPDVAVIPDVATPDAPLPSPDAPSPDSYVARCGNGILDTGEACDEGEGNNNLTPNACRANCTLPFCGDGVVDADEACEGMTGMSCTTSCGISGVAVCQSETCTLGVCIPPEDICNGVDDDCNGVADNWFACAVGAVEDCTPICGERGSRSCSDSCAWDACVAIDTLCDDDDPCTVGDHCEGEACVAEPIVCASPAPAVCANATTRRTYAAVGTCDVDGECSYTPTDTVCNDANACTTDACSAGVCITSQITCADGNPCTDDSCDPATGCVFTANTLACDDGIACTSADVCGGGSCAGVSIVCTSPPVSECRDGATLRTFVSVGTCLGGECSYAATDTICDDRDACTTDSCVAGACAFTPIACVNPAPAECSNGTTRRTYAAIGSCSSGTCSYVSTDTVCNDANACTTDACSGGVCTSIPIVCVNPPVNECADGVTLRTYAAAGICLRGVCDYAATDTVCNDSDTCTIDACTTGVFCAPADPCPPPTPGICVYTPIECTFQPAQECLPGPSVRTYSSVGTCSGGSCSYSFRDDACIAWSNTTPTCESGFCWYVCNPRYADCNRRVADGCEINIGNDPSNCGACGNVCFDPVSGSPVCNLGSCGIRCDFGYTTCYSGVCCALGWATTTTTGAPSARSGSTAVWTGSAMIVFGGLYVGGGGRYFPQSNTWLPIPATPERGRHTAIWTGSEMIIWGGTIGSGIDFNTGLRYNLSTNSWSAITTIGAPSARAYHTAVWTGSEMIVWGGSPEGIPVQPAYNTGGRYDPISDSWSTTSTTDVPLTRVRHTAVWTGSEMIVWGGFISLGGGSLNTGGQYDPIADTWVATTTTDAPSARAWHVAVWADSQMIVWGGGTITGGRYDPVRDIWTPTSTVGAPGVRDWEGNHQQSVAVWTGSEMIVWGGQASGGFLNTGGRYNPVSDSWISVTMSGVPAGRDLHVAIWTGAQVIVWGGYNGAFFNTGGRYTPP